MLATVNALRPGAELSSPLFPRTPSPRSVASEYLPSDDEAPDHEEFDGSPQPGARFDDPTPAQLENRGITPQPTARLTEPGREVRQSEFWAKQTAWKFTVAAKLRTAGMLDDAATLEHCHSTFTIAVCNDCQRKRQFSNRCENFFCPECQPRLSSDRQAAVDWWAREVSNPKHVVLTVRNIKDLQPGHVTEFKKWWTRLRRRKFARHWKGGFYCLEVTNEGRGWHLHLHAFIDAAWIEASELARQWSAVNGGAGHIVAVRGSHGNDYRKEVAKYVVKGNQLASWTPDEIATFVVAFRNQRTFGVFGSLYGKRTEFAEWIDSIRNKKPRCDCGSCNVSYYSESEFLLLDLVPETTAKPRPPPKPETPLFSPDFVRATQPRH